MSLYKFFFKQINYNEFFPEKSYRGKYNNTVITISLQQHNYDLETIIIRFFVIVIVYMKRKSSNIKICSSYSYFERL